MFWDCKGVLLIKTLPRNKTITAEVYCEALDELVVSLREKRRRTVAQGFNNIHFLHDNARPHAALITQRKLAELEFTILPHPPYSPDLSPSDYYLFSPLKCSLKGRDFNTKEEVDLAINQWVDAKPTDFFRKGIHSLPGRWQQCINALGDYFSKIEDTDE